MVGFLLFSGLPNPVLITVKDFVKKLFKLEPTSGNYGKIGVDMREGG